MQHYIALLWNATLQRSSMESTRLQALISCDTTQWQQLISAQGLVVYSQASVDPAMHTYVLPNTTGVIFGTLFSTADSSDHPVEASQLDGGILMRNNAAELLRGYWGNYLGFLRSQKDNASLVIRDCSGHIPCYYVNTNGVYIFFSDIRDVCALSLQFSINARYLCYFLFRHPLHIRETGLKEVTELLAGDGVEMSATGTRHKSLWDPRLIATSKSIDDYVRARSHLITSTERVIASWASVYRRILLSLSGGFDSATVLGCLSRMGYADRVICVNQYTEGTADDERRYARAAAAMAGARLTEVPRGDNVANFIDKLELIPFEPKPDVAKIVRVMLVDGMNSLAGAFKCDTIWTGQGGDHIFLQTHAPYGATDYLMSNQLPVRAWSMIYDSAFLSRKSIWFVILQTIRYRLGIDTCPPENLSGSGKRFLTKEGLPDRPQTDLCPPWHLGSNRLHPGKQYQIDQLSDLLNRERPFLRLQRPYEQHPLVSQPLIELSLQIPTYQLLRGGRQRAMARDAFADRVPDCIIKREDKGHTKDNVRALLRASAEALRETLLDGTLISLGILDRVPLDNILRRSDTFRANEQFPLLACIAAELWTRKWSSERARSTTA